MMFSVVSVMVLNSYFKIVTVQRILDNVLEIAKKPLLWYSVSTPFWLCCAFCSYYLLWYFIPRFLVSFIFYFICYLLLPAFLMAPFFYILYKGFSFLRNILNKAKSN